MTVCGAGAEPGPGAEGVPEGLVLQIGTQLKRLQIRNSFAFFLNTRKQIFISFYFCFVSVFGFGFLFVSETVAWLWLWL